jgi:hypothetical protein
MVRTYKRDNSLIESHENKQENNKTQQLALLLCFLCKSPICVIRICSKYLWNRCDKAGLVALLILMLPHGRL